MKTTPAPFHPPHTMPNPNKTASPSGLFMLTQSANACDRIANGLDRLAAGYDGDPEAEGLARLLSEYANELAHHADAIREASGLNALTQANLDDIKRRL